MIPVRQHQLSVRTSTLRQGHRLDHNDVGYGLFGGPYTNGEVIAIFSGEKTPLDRYELLQAIGLGDYGIYVGGRSPYVLDCWESAVVTNTCLASMANDPAEDNNDADINGLACWLLIDNGLAVRARANSHVRIEGGIAKLIAGRPDDDTFEDENLIAIHQNEEILWSYRAEFFNRAF
jgi:hypothetical protein